MKSDKLSPRQLSVAVLVGGLSTGAAAAGRADWRWLLACVPVGAPAGWLRLRKVGRTPLQPGPRVLHRFWAVLRMADALDRTAAQTQPAAGGRGNAGSLLSVMR